MVFNKKEIEKKVEKVEKKPEPKVVDKKLDDGEIDLLAAKKQDVVKEEGDIDLSPNVVIKA